MLSCGLRELQEETGLCFKPENVKLSVLCLWESVYPMMLPFGLPRSHHVVVYLYAKSPFTSDELASRIKVNILPFLNNCAKFNLFIILVFFCLVGS